MRLVSSGMISRGFEEGYCFASKPEVSRKVLTDPDMLNRTSASVDWAAECTCCDIGSRIVNTTRGNKGIAEGIVNIEVIVCLLLGFRRLTREGMSRTRTIRCWFAKLLTQQPLVIHVTS